MIQYEEVKGSLENMAYRANDLAKRLGKEGESLSLEDQELCRLALMPRFEELQMMLKIEFMSGNVQRYEHMMESLMEFPMFMVNFQANSRESRRKK